MFKHYVLSYVFASRKTWRQGVNFGYYKTVAYVGLCTELVVFL